MKKFFLLTFIIAAKFSQAQNVGIGITTPLAKLHVFNGASGNSTPYSPFVVEGNNNTFFNLLSPNANETGVLFGKAENAASGGIVYNNVATLNGLQFRNNGNLTRMVIDNSGKVGIGTTTPAARLDIAGTDSWDLTNSEGDVRIGNSTYRLKIGVALSGGGAGAVNLMQYGQAGGYNALSLGSQGNTIMHLIGSNGFVGIGTNIPGEKLHVAGNIKADTVKPNSIKLLPNAGTGKVLTSDASGNASWQESRTGGSVGFGSWGDCSIRLLEYNPVADGTGAVMDRFGSSVSISGNFAIAGSPLDDGSFTDQGSASIYQHNGSNWVLMQKLTDATGAMDDRFGISVSISGNYAIVGSEGDDVGINSDQGSASIYQYNGTNWVLMQKIIDATGASGDQAGVSVSIAGNYAIVGSSYDDGSAGSDQGSASIYWYDSGNWNLQQKIMDPAATAGDRLGISVSLSGNYAIVGAFVDDEIILNQGSASIYQYNLGNWVFMQKIVDATGAAYDYFGYSVSISGNYAIIGAFSDDVGANQDQGSASIFQFNGTSWILMQKITDPGGGRDEFGFSVSISGNYAIVGAHRDNLGVNIAQGSAGIYVRVGPGWGRVQYVTDPMGNIEEYFGYASSIDGSTERFVIGAPFYASSTGKIVFGKIN